MTLLVCSACQAPAVPDATAPTRVSYENITFVSGDGRSYVNYVTTRSDAAEYTVFLEKSASLRDYLYMNPPSYELDTTQPERNRLKFAQGGYALISQGQMDEDARDGSRVSVDDDGIFTLSTWTGEALANGHYGYWNRPGAFDHFAIAWSFADGFEPIEYHGNRDGQWERRGNTLAFFAQDVNDLTFTIRYRARSQPHFELLREALADEPAVAVEQDPQAVNLILKEEILFGSGQHRITDSGASVVGRIADTLNQMEDYRIEVSGHTDDVPITGALHGDIRDNWGLSAQRAINVVRALSAAGVSETVLSLSAHGATRPRVPNTSEDNRQANRRIEISILAED